MSELLALNAWSTSVSRGAVTLLLKVPMDAISREQRESIVGSLFKNLPKKTIHSSDLKPILSLMIKLMAKPTFYQVRNLTPLLPSLLMLNMNARA